MRLQTLCDEMVGDVQGATGCALVDLGTGLPIAVSVTNGTSGQDAADTRGHGAPDHGPAALEALAAAGTDFFRGVVNRDLRDAMRDPALPESFVQEVQTATADSYHFMSVVPGKEQTVLMLVTDRNVNLGLGWAAMRTMLDRVCAAASNPRAARIAAMAAGGPRHQAGMPPVRGPASFAALRQQQDDPHVRR